MLSATEICDDKITYSHIILLNACVDDSPATH